jgi:hypothetical protein
MTSEMETAARYAGQGDYLFDDDRERGRAQARHGSRERVVHWRARRRGLAMTDVAAMACAAAGALLLAVVMTGRMSGRRSGDGRAQRMRAGRALEDAGRMNWRNL